MYIVDGNMLKINSNKILFQNEIREVVMYNGCFIVLLSVPYNTIDIDNIYCVDENGSLLWQVEGLSKVFPDLKALPYEQMGIKEETLFASDFYGRNYTIDLSNGKIKDCKIVK